MLQKSYLMDAAQRTCPLSAGFSKFIQSEALLIHRQIVFGKATLCFVCYYFFLHTVT